MNTSISSSRLAMAAILALHYLCVGVCAAAPYCSEEGGFGIRFGSPLPKGATLLERGEYASRYEVRPPEPDTGFDTFRVNVNNDTGEVLRVMAIKEITRKPELSAPPLSPERRLQGQAEAKAFALRYIAQLPPDLQALVALDRHSTADWTSRIGDHAVQEIFASFAWDVMVTCRDLPREDEIFRKAMFGAAARKGP